MVFLVSDAFVKQWIKPEQDTNKMNTAVTLINKLCFQVLYSDFHWALFGVFTTVIVNYDSVRIPHKGTETEKKHSAKILNGSLYKPNFRSSNDEHIHVVLNLAEKIPKYKST